MVFFNPCERVSTDAGGSCFCYHKSSTLLAKDLSGMNFTKLTEQFIEARKLAGSRTAILWGHEDLFREAVENLINRMKNWKVTRMSDEHGETDLIREISRIKPDVVILSRSGASCKSNLPYRLIENHPNMGIIIVSSESNLVEIFCRREAAITGPADLLSIIDQSANIPFQEGGDWQKD